MARCERLRGAALRDVLGQTQGVLFDCDGVLWNGERIVPGAPELLQRLARAGKNTLFVSNNSRRARPELALRFARLGFAGLRAEQLFSSALCAARLLRQRLSGPPDAPGAVFVLGGEGLRAELRAAGLRLAGDPGETPRVRAVLVGYDEQFSFARLTEACAHLRDPDCLLVATDRDPWHPLSDGSRTPGECGTGRGIVCRDPPCVSAAACQIVAEDQSATWELQVGSRFGTGLLGFCHWPHPLCRWVSRGGLEGWCWWRAGFAHPESG